MRDIQTSITGNATADPAIHKHRDGSESTSVRIAVTGSYFDREKGEFVDRRTEFITVYARRGLGQNLAHSVRKGQPLVVSGRLGSSEWVDKEGVTRFSLTLWAETIGHDLRYGSAVFTRPTRAADVPVFDHDTGVILPEDVSDGADDLRQDDAEEETSEERELAGSAPF